MLLYYADDPGQDMAIYWNFIRPYIVRYTIRWTRGADGQIYIVA